MEDNVERFGLINFVNARMYIQNKLLKDFLKFLEKNTPNLKDLKGAQGFLQYIAVKLFA